MILIICAGRRSCPFKKHHSTDEIIELTSHEFDMYMSEKSLTLSLRKLDDTASVPQKRSLKKC
ncbi:MAG: hypothetical protein HY808_09515 [Nitrospirae bacterium]|nr:hypothetical protein [Nitrospirota bacterium]